MFKNLLGNDFKYSRMDSNPVEISIRADNNVLLVKIKDDRPDIPEEDIPQLFEPFFRVDRFRLKKTGGHGLGLSLSKKKWMHTGEKLRYQIMRKEAYQ